MRLEVKAKHFACSRTKNRLREHSNFVVTKPPQPCAFDPSGEKWLHVEADDGWKGWLPIKELEIENA